MAEYSKPKVTIDLDEYNDLKQTEKKYNESSESGIIKKFETSLEKLINQINKNLTSTHLESKVVNDYLYILKDHGIEVRMKFNATERYTSVKILDITN
jgi:hypothetical protein